MLGSVQVAKRVPVRVLEKDKKSGAVIVEPPVVADVK
jgi:hypothetical protein